jgi:hypothetical protein
MASASYKRWLAFTSTRGHRGNVEPGGRFAPAFRSVQSWHARPTDIPDACSVSRLSDSAMVLWRAMGAERNLAQHSTCRRHSVSFCANVFCRLRCLELRARGDSHLRAGADLDYLGDTHGDFRSARSLLQVRTLISARRNVRRWHKVDSEISAKSRHRRLVLLATVPLHP